MTTSSSQLSKYFAIVAALSLNACSDNAPRSSVDAEDSFDGAQSCAAPAVHVSEQFQTLGSPITVTVCSADAVIDVEPLDDTQPPAVASFDTPAGSCAAAATTVQLRSPPSPSRVRVSAARDSRCAEQPESTTLTWLSAWERQSASSGSIAHGMESDGSHTWAVVEEDAAMLTTFAIRDDGTIESLGSYNTCNRPRRVARSESYWAVTCPTLDTISLHPTGAPTSREDIVLAWGTAPFGVVADTREADTFFVNSRFRRSLYRVDTSTSQPSASPVGPELPFADARGLVQLRDGTLIASRWRSPDSSGQLALVSGDLTEVSRFDVPFDDRPSSDTENGGVPTYLDTITVTPDGSTLLLSGLQANINQGLALNGNPMNHDEVMRGVLIYLDITSHDDSPLPTLVERTRTLFDDRGLASDVATTPEGDFAYVLSRGHRSIERVDLLRNGVAAGTQLFVGFAPESIAITENGVAIVHSPLAREVTTWPARDFGNSFSPISRIATTDAEPLEDEVLRGKILFNDSADPRLTGDGYLACAHCHLDGESDRRTWDFTERGEGLRNTITLLGRSGDGHGRMHWSANFDEVHDFENDIRMHFSGTGLLDEDDWGDPDVQNPLGDAKAGRSDDLDALAAYVSTLSDYPRSPYRNADGTLTENAEFGEEIFLREDTGCTSCHFGNDLLHDADATTPSTLFNVGTLTELSGSRLGAELSGLDTPTLRGLFNNAPFLHDGSAATVRDVVTTNNPDDAHGTTSHLSETELDALVEWLLSLGERRD